MGDVRARSCHAFAGAVLIASYPLPHCRQSQPVSPHQINRRGAEGKVRLAAAEEKGKNQSPPPPPNAPANNGALSIAERMAIQFDLAWTGDFTGLITGEAGEKTTEAIKSFQSNRKSKETGVLNAQERAALAAAAKARQERAGWTLVEDPVTGAQLGIPTNRVPHKTQGKTGTRWSSAQGQIQVETFRIREPGTTLEQVYERQKKEPATRRLNVNLLKPDFFVLSGMQGLKKFYRARRHQGRRGARHDGALGPGRRSHHGMRRSRCPARSRHFRAWPSRSGNAPPKRKVEYGTGIVVSAAGHILTDRQVTDGCSVIVVGGYGDADRQAEDKAADLALIRLFMARPIWCPPRS